MGLIDNKNPRGPAPHRGFRRATRCPVKFLSPLSDQLTSEIWSLSPAPLSPERPRLRRMPCAVCRMPHAACRMPHAVCLMPYAVCLTPYASRRMPAPCSMLHAFALACHAAATKCEGGSLSLSLSLRRSRITFPSHFSLRLSAAITRHSGSAVCRMPAPCSMLHAPRFRHSLVTPRQGEGGSLVTTAV